ncbi:ATP-binding protein [Streptomyces sp. NPDC058657]|uniref:ATP-binding protein n=1 Tax=Streptomyces sp. NPDC058657 TaxID=3346579 RepID=UPI003669D549
MTKLRKATSCPADRGTDSITAPARGAGPRKAKAETGKATTGHRDLSGPALKVHPQTQDANRGEAGCRVFIEAFAPDAAHVKGMRHSTAAVLKAWGLHGPAVPEIVLSVCELVTNTIVHGWGDATLRIRYRDRVVHIEVTDDNPAPARLRPASSGDVSGRGLALIDAFADGWGVSNDGRTTWATFLTAAGRP